MTDPLSTEEYQAHIRQRAEQLWEEAGRPEGQDEHFWFMAEQAFAADHPEIAEAGITLPPEDHHDHELEHDHGHDHHHDHEHHDHVA